MFKTHLKERISKKKTSSSFGGGFAPKRGYNLCYKA